MVQFDVPPYERGEEPFCAIMAAMNSLQRDEQLLLLNCFEPKPLYAVIKKYGFDHTTMEMGNDAWCVLFKRQ
jgi:uncharacterized protein (DUF2249 family)